jgi:hypothetical protein
MRNGLLSLWIKEMPDAAVVSNANPDATAANDCIVCKNRPLVAKRNL